MQVAIAGGGPAVSAVRAALGDVDATGVETTPGGLGACPLGVLVAPAGSPAFAAADAAADRWLGVEIGGLGGRPFDDLDAAVTVFADGVGYADLRDRVASTVEAATDEPVDVDAADGTAGDDDPTGDRSAVRLAGAVAGRRAVSLLAGANLAGTVVEVPGEERRVLPVPRPDARDRDLRRDHREATLDDALARAERAVDDRVGPLVAVGERESFPVPYYLARTADTTAYGDARAARHAAGVDDDWNRAFMKAVGEGIERYCAGVYRREEFDRATARERPDAVPPSAFVAPDDRSADDGRPRAWVPGEDLATGDAVSLPAALVHHPPPGDADPPRPPITTGLGLGTGGVEALLSGLYEVVERDATMLSWYSTYDPLGLTVEDEGFDALVARARAERLAVTPLLCTVDVDVPVVAVAVHREGEWPRFAVGSDADLDAVAAARAALAEALQNWMELRAMGREDAASEEGAVARHADFPPAARSFVDADDGVPASAVGADPLPAGAAELDAVVERATDAGLSVYGSRVTTPDVDRLGFEAVRVLSPGAQPLFVDEPYFGARATGVPERLGYEPRLDRAFHPYP